MPSSEKALCPLTGTCERAARNLIDSSSLTSLARFACKVGGGMALARRQPCQWQGVEGDCYDYESTDERYQV